MNPRRIFTAFALLALCSLVVVSAASAQQIALPGDFNGDGMVDGVDFFMYALTFDPHGYRASPEADGNQDFHVDHRDLHLAIWSRLRGLLEPVPFDPNQVGDVEGVVLQEVGDALVVLPIAGAEVWIGLPDGFRFETLTNENGQFRFEGVPAGVAYLRAARPGYHPGEARAQVVAGHVVQVTLALAPYRDDLTDVVGFIHGLIDPESRDRVPVHGATIRIMPLEDGEVPSTLDPQHDPGSPDPDQVAFTNERGHYRLHDIPLGAHLMVVFAPGFESERREIFIESPRDRLEDFLLSPIDTRSGRVKGMVFSFVDLPNVDQIPIPLPGAVVTLEPLFDLGGDPGQNPLTDFPLPFPYYETVSNESGEFFFRNVFPGPYHARAWAPEHEPRETMLEVLEGDTIEQDFFLPQIVIDRGNLAGRIFGASQDLELPVPLPHAAVAVFPLVDRIGPFPPENQTGIVDPSFLRSTTTDEEGNYFFEGLRIGEYLLIARAQGWGKATDTVEIVKDVTTTADLVIVYTPPPPPATLAGRVLSVSHDANLQEPIEGAVVLAFPTHSDLIDILPPIPVAGIKSLAGFPGPLPPEWAPFRTETNENGAYLLPLLPPGPYRVVALAEGFHPSEVLITLPPDATVEQDFFLDPVSEDFGIVLGRVFTLSADGAIHPVGGAKVVLEGLAPPIGFFDSTLDPSLFPIVRFQTESDPNGHFEFPRVPSGSYILCVQADGFRTFKADLHVAPGEEVPIEAEIVPRANGDSGEIEGHVYHAVNIFGVAPERLEPVTGALVTAIPLCGLGGQIPTDPNEILPDDGPCFPRVTRTGPDGFYRFEEIPPGPVIVLILAEGFDPALEDTFVEPGGSRILDFFLEPIGSSDPPSLFGQVTQRTEFPTFAPVPVEGAEVRIRLGDLTIPPILTGEIVPPEIELVTITNLRGDYRFENLVAGVYEMAVQAEGFVPVTELHVRIPTGGQVRRNILMERLFTGEGRLHGTVYQPPDEVGEDNPDPRKGFEPDRVPAEDAIVRLVPEGLVVIEIFPPPNVGFDRVTDASGNYEFESLPAGWYNAYVLKEGFVPAFDNILIEDGDDETRDYFVHPVREPQTRVEGVVTEETGLLPVWIPIPGALLVLVDSEGEVHETHSRPEGSYVFEEVHPGPFNLRVEADGYLTQMREREVGPGQTAFEPFALVAEGTGPGSIFGNVQEFTGFLDVWIPIEGAQVSLFGPEKGTGPFRTTMTDGEGRFVFNDLPPGAYGILVEAEGHRPEDARVELQPGQNEFVLFELRSRAQGDLGAVEGHVTIETPSGAPEPVAGIAVFLRSPDGTIGSDLLGHSVVTDERGRYRFEEVPAGTVTVFVGFPGDEGPSRTVEVPAGGTATANFVLDPMIIPIPF